MLSKMKIRIIRKKGSTITKDYFINSQASLSKLDAPAYVLVANDVKHLDLSFVYPEERENKVKTPLPMGTVVYGRTSGRILQLSLNGTGKIPSLAERTQITQAITAKMSSTMVNRFNAGMGLASEIEEAYGG